jgi:ABC-type transport system involved in cytochrome c biogenesis permease subunit
VIPGTFMPFWGALPLYVAAGALYAVSFFSERRDLARRASLLVGVNILLHALGLLILGAQRGAWPPVSTGESLSEVALATAMIYLYLEVRTAQRGMGLFALVLVIAFQLGAAVRGAAHTVSPILHSPILAPHTFANILAFTSFTIGAFTSVTYLLQYRRLRSGRPGTLFTRLPPLEVVDTMTFRSTQAGMLFLTVGMVLGAILAHIKWGRAWSWDPKQCTTLTIWLLYALVLYLRRFRSWQGGRISAMTLTAFGAVVLSLFLVSTVIKSAHQFA